MIFLGFKLMFLGMFMVLVFLSLLFVAIHAMRPLTAFFPEAETTSIETNSSSPREESYTLLAVMGAAIEAFETDKKRYKGELP